MKLAPGDPDAACDSGWLDAVLGRAVETLRRELNAQGRAQRFRVFELYDLGRGERTYRSVARATGLSESDVTNRLHEARRRLREIVVREIAEYALDASDAVEELRWILK